MPDQTHATIGDVREIQRRQGWSDSTLLGMTLDVLQDLGYLDDMFSHAAAAAERERKAVEGLSVEARERHEREEARRRRDAIEARRPPSLELDALPAPGQSRRKRR